MKKRAQIAVWVIISCVLVASIILVTLTLLYFDGPGLDPNECNQDSDCIRMQVTCCPCSRGGERNCVSVFESQEIMNRITDCPADLDSICPAAGTPGAFNCFPGASTCKCIEGKCG